MVLRGDLSKGCVRSTPRNRISNPIPVSLGIKSELRGNDLFRLETGTRFRCQRLIRLFAHILSATAPQITLKVLQKSQRSAQELRDLARCLGR